MSNQPAYALDVSHTTPSGHSAMLHIRGDNPAAFATSVLTASSWYPGLAECLDLDAVRADATHTPRAGAAAPARPAPPKVAAVPDPDGEECPQHGLASPSRYGGLYCPYQDDVTGAYCRWTSGATKGATRRARRPA